MAYQTSGWVETLKVCSIKDWLFFFLKKNDKITIIDVYVNDIIITKDDINEIQSLKDIWIMLELK